MTVNRVTVKEVVMKIELKSTKIIWWTSLKYTVPVSEVIYRDVTTRTGGGRE